MQRNREPARQRRRPESLDQELDCQEQSARSRSVADLRPVGDQSRSVRAPQRRSRIAAGSGIHHQERTAWRGHRVHARNGHEYRGLSVHCQPLRSFREAIPEGRVIPAERAVALGGPCTDLALGRDTLGRTPMPGRQGLALRHVHHHTPPPQESRRCRLPRCRGAGMVTRQGRRGTDRQRYRDHDRRTTPGLSPQADTRSCRVISSSFAPLGRLEKAMKRTRKRVKEGWAVGLQSLPSLARSFRDALDCGEFHLARLGVGRVSPLGAFFPPLSYVQLPLLRQSGPDRVSSDVAHQRQMEKIIFRFTLFPSSLCCGKSPISLLRSSKHQTISRRLASRSSTRSCVIRAR
jgi:hypothetical protein